MSGEITVTAGHDWATGTVTLDKLSQAANPTARVDEDAITSREIDSADFLETFADSFRGANFFYNPVFWEPYWEDTSVDGKECPAAEWTENAQGWAVYPAGDVVEYRRVEDVPSESTKSKYALKFVGSATTGGVQVRQCVTGDIAQQLSGGDVTVSFYYKSNFELSSGDRSVSIYVNTTAGDSSATTLATTSGLSAYDGLSEWVRETVTFDLTGISHLDRGFSIVIDLGTLASDTNFASVTQMQLEIGDAASSFINPVNPGQRLIGDVYATSAPAATDDLRYGYRPGSRIIDVSTAGMPDVYVMAKNDFGDAEWALVTQSKVMRVQDQRAEGVHGGNYTAGAHVVRTVNTLVTDEIVGSSLSSNQITLPPGKYRVAARVVGHNTAWSAAWLYDTTASAIIVNGLTVYLASMSGVFHVSGEFTLTEESVLEFRYRGTSSATNGLGTASALSRGGELYLDAVFSRLSN